MNHIIQNKYIVLDYIMNTIEDDYIVLNPRTKEIHLLNQVAAFLLNNCNEKTVEELVYQLYEACINKDELDLQLIKNDCEMTMMKMIDKGLIYTEEADAL